MTFKEIIFYIGGLIIFYFFFCVLLAFIWATYQALVHKERFFEKFGETFLHLFVEILWPPNWF